MLDPLDFFVKRNTMTIQVGLEEAAARGSDSTYSGVR